MALTQAQIDALNKETTAKRLAQEAAQTDREQAQKDELSSTLSSKTTLTDEQKNALSLSQLQNLANNTTNQRLTADLTPSQLSGTSAINTTGVPSATNDIATMQNDLYAAQNAATISALDKAKNESLATLQKEQDAITPAYAEQRSQTRTTSELGAQSFSDFMAQRGLQSSGGSALGETMRQGALQGSLTDLRTSEQQALEDVASRRSSVEGAYQSDVATATANMEATKLQDAIAQAQADEVAQTQADALAREQFIQTASQFAGDYQAQINKVLNDNDPNNDWQSDVLNALRQEKIANQGLDQSGNATATLPTYSQALEAYRMGIRSEDVMSVLNAAAGGTTTSGGGGTYTGGLPTEADVPTTEADTIVGYNDLGKLLDQGTVTFDEETKQTNRADTDPLQKIRQIQENYAKYSEQYTQEAVDKMVQDLYAETQPQEEVVTEEPVVEEKIGVSDYKTSEDFSADVEMINKTNDTELESLLSELQNNSAAFQNKYGYTGYQELVKLIQDRLD